MAVKILKLGSAPNYRPSLFGRWGCLARVVKIEVAGATGPEALKVPAKNKLWSLGWHQQHEGNFSVRICELHIAFAHVGPARE